MVKDHSFGQMVEDIRDSISIIKDRVWEHSNGPMVKSILAFGKGVLCMVEA